MANKNNFMWLTGDIDNTLVLKVVYIKDNIVEEYGVFNVCDVLETTGDSLSVETANIDDLTNLLTLGIVRFVNVIDSSDIIDIPFRKLHLLYDNANVLGEGGSSKYIPFSELDTFSVIDGTVRNDLLVFSASINRQSDDLSEIMKIASTFSSLGMQEKFDALSRVNLINHRRMVNDEKERLLKQN